MFSQFRSADVYQSLHCLKIINLDFLCFIPLMIGAFLGGKYNSKWPYICRYVGKQRRCLKGVDSRCAQIDTYTNSRSILEHPCSISHGGVSIRLLVVLKRAYKSTLGSLFSLHSYFTFKRRELSLDHYNYSSHESCLLFIRLSF